MRTAHVLAAGLLSASLVLTGCAKASVTDTPVDTGAAMSSSAPVMMQAESSSSSSSSSSVEAMEGAAMSVDVQVQ